MMKWITGLLAMIAIGWFIYSQTHGVKTAYVNGLPEYNGLPGQEYIFERDCYIFKFVHKNSAWPLVSANFRGNPSNISDLPEVVSPDHVGKAIGAIRILDTVRMGSRFKIVSVRRDERQGETSISFEILFTDEGDRHYPRLDAFWIMDHTFDERGIAPTILEAFAVPRIKK